MAEANLGLRGLKVGRTKHTLHRSYYLKQLLASLGERDVGKGVSLVLWEPGQIWQTVGAPILGSDLTGWRQKPWW